MIGGRGGEGEGWEITTTKQILCKGKCQEKKNHAKGREKKKQTPAEVNAPKNAKLPVISHLVEINFLMKYLGKNAVRKQHFQA